MGRWVDGLQASRALTVRLWLSIVAEHESLQPQGTAGESASQRLTSMCADAGAENTGWNCSVSQLG